MGRVYRTTSPELDLLRSVLTFDVDRLLMTELWDDDNEQLNEQVNDNAKDKEQQDNQKEKEKDTHASNVEVLKLQKFCLFLYERLERLEKQLLTVNNTTDGEKDENCSNNVV